MEQNKYDEIADLPDIENIKDDDNQDDDVIVQNHQDQSLLRQKLEEMGLRPNRSNSDIQVEDIIKLANAGIFDSTKDRPTHDSGVRLKPPTFNGKSCLEDAALDLYLSLDQDKQQDLEALEINFHQHFKPLNRKPQLLWGWKKVWIKVSPNFILR